MTIDFQKINIDTFNGKIPTGYDLVMIENSCQHSKFLIKVSGLEEIAYYDNDFVEPIFGFLKK